MPAPYAYAFGSCRVCVWLLRHRRPFVLARVGPGAALTLMRPRIIRQPLLIALTCVCVRQGHVVCVCVSYTY